MDPKIVKKTQDTLGKVIKKPPLTEKLLGKPPFRFLHDVVTSVIKTTGFMQGLYTDSEMNSENVKDKDSKQAFLQKLIDMVSTVTSKSLSAKTAKIVAGHEPEKTNELLQALADAINRNVDNDEYVKRVLKGGGGGSSSKEERKDKDRTKSADRRKARGSEDPDKHEEKKDKDRERSRDKGDREKRHDREDRDRKHDKDRDRDKEDRDRRHEKDKDRHKDRDRDRDRESKTREKSRDGRDEKHRDRSRKRDQSGEKENESPRENGEKEEKQEPPSRLQRPASAKGSRRRREEDEEFQKPSAPSHEPVMGEDALPPQVAAARQLARPSSARPAPPRPKQEASESEPAMRLGQGQPTNLIVDNDDDDEDLNFLVEESAPPPPEPDMTLSKPPTEEDDAEHGALVKKMLESKKELEGGSQNQTGPPKKTEIERPMMSDAQRRKQREIVQKEVDKLRTSIQGLTRSANPLGKVMDYVQEDLDSMQQELDKWKTENAQHALDLKREMSVTDRAIEPLRQQLTELERAIGDQLDQIAATKANIIRNDQKIAKMLRGIAGS